MRSFRQLSKSIIDMIEPDLHRVSVEEILGTLQQAAEANKRESQGRPAFQVDVTDEYVDFRIHNPDADCFESSMHPRNFKDKAGERSLLKWISNALSRLLDLQELRWYLVESNQTKHYSPTSRSKLNRVAKDPESGLVSVKQGFYRVREDRIKDHVKRDQVENLKPFLG
jgi:hypothetical protein